jgi:hypothetical protein
LANHDDYKAGLEAARRGLAAPPKGNGTEESQKNRDAGFNAGQNKK